MIAVVVPIYNNILQPDEITSLRHLTNVLDAYDKFWVAPDDLGIETQGWRVRHFNRRYFTSTNTYSQLFLSRQLYEAFANYTYILIYQLDCLVFSDQLEAWCQLGYDYIGAPWFKSRQDPTKGFSRAGNGGFSLRKVDSFLKVLESNRYASKRLPFMRDLVRPLYDHNLPTNIVQYWKKKLRVLKDVLRGVQWYTSHYTLNEDRFWSDRAQYFYPDFKIVPIDLALKFSFERFPRYCFEHNDRQLPFGCHAWHKWDRSFWEPYLIF